MAPKLSNAITKALRMRVHGGWMPVYKEWEPSPGAVNVNGGHGMYYYITKDGREEWPGRTQIVDYVWRAPLYAPDMKPNTPKPTI